MGAHVIRKEVVFALTIALLGCGSCSRGSDVCDSLTSIARDEEKMAYAKRWIVAGLSDDAFRQSIRNGHVLESTDERLQQFGGFSWKHLGFPERYAELVFITSVTEAKEWDANQVHSVTLDWGRSFILIKLSATGGIGLPLASDDVAKIKTVREGIYVYCYEGAGDR